MPMRRQAPILINQFNNISTNQQVQMASTVVNYVLIPFRENINPGDPQGLKLYLKAIKEKTRDITSYLSQFQTLQTLYITL